MPCPECNASQVNLIKQDTPDQGDAVFEEYECDECECCWEWKMERIITHHGKEYEKE